MTAFLTDPGAFLGKTYLDLMVAANHAKHCRAEDYGVLLLWTIFRHGSRETRALVAQALFVDLPRRRRRQVLRRPLRACLQWLSSGPDLLLYAEGVLGAFGPGGQPRNPVVVILEAKRDGGNPQARPLAPILLKHPVDDTLAPGVDLYADVAADPDAYLDQVDVYALLPDSYMGVYTDLYMRPQEAAFIFFTGSSTATVANQYDAYSEAAWSNVRWSPVADRLRPHLESGAFATDEDLVALWVALLDVPWYGPRHLDADAPLLPRLTTAPADDRPGRAKDSDTCVGQMGAGPRQSSRDARRLLRPIETLMNASESPAAVALGPPGTRSSAHSTMLMPLEGR